MTPSPYHQKPEVEWLGITRKLVETHPLKSDLLLNAALAAWDKIWQTTVGSGETAVRLSEIKVPATIIGYFFEILLVRELESREQSIWRGSRSKEEKDLVYVKDPSLSVEIKASGQAGFKIFGNRSYGQKSKNDALVKKEKSGYYITVNFFDQTLTLIRFGWIDADDWTPQRAQTGQMSGLAQAVYDHKLLPLSGPYRLKTPIFFLDGVGPSSADDFEKLHIRTIGDLIQYKGELPSRLAKIKANNIDLLKNLTDISKC